MGKKSKQLQIRVTPEQKRTIERLARAAGQSVSSYVLDRAIPEARTRFLELTETLGASAGARYALAELNDLLSGLSLSQLRDAVELPPPGFTELAPLHQNYLAAMIEHACHRRGVRPPKWIERAVPLERPHFATPLPGLRLHLLKASPVAFKRRDIYVDSTLGDRV